jgi:hypothetical protein
MLASGSFQPPQYANGIASSSTICNAKCVTEVCQENEPCKIIGDNSTDIAKDNSTTNRDNSTLSSVPLRTL